MDCLFCKIAKNQIPSEKVYEDDFVLAFKDIHPQAPVHILVIPKDHIQSLDDVNSQNVSFITRIFQAVPKIAEKMGVKGEYRLVSNCGERSGQTVMHLHFHIIAGRDMKWPPG